MRASIANAAALAPDSAIHFTLTTTTCLTLAAAISIAIAATFAPTIH